MATAMATTMDISITLTEPQEKTKSIEFSIDDDDCNEDNEYGMDFDNMSEISEISESDLEKELYPNKILENFKIIQFPFNILETDAFTKTTQIIENKNVSLIRAANYHNINCYISAPYGQGKINDIKLPDEINKTFYGKNNFQKALSFCMSVPYIKTIILGTKQLNHLNDAIDVINFDGHSESLFYSLFKK